MYAWPLCGTLGHLWNCSCSECHVTEYFVDLLYKSSVYSTVAQSHSCRVCSSIMNFVFGVLLVAFCPVCVIVSPPCALLSQDRLMTIVILTKIKQLLKMNELNIFSFISSSPLIFLFQMLLHLFSDANYNLLGFNATYTFSLCPGDCAGHGRCDVVSSRCQCHQGWGGTDCSLPVCSTDCTQRGHGRCDKVFSFFVCCKLVGLIFNF